MLGWMTLIVQHLSENLLPLLFRVVDKEVSIVRVKTNNTEVSDLDDLRFMLNMRTVFNNSLDVSLLESPRVRHLG